jgi:sec-independent protein translocase protein TatB
VNFLNVGPWELTVIIIIAILLVGPKRIVEITRMIGRMTAQLRRFSSEFVSTLQAEVTASGSDGNASQDPQSVIRSITEPITSLQSELVAAGRETRQAIENIVEGKAEPTESIQAEPQATQDGSDTTQKEPQSLVKSITEPITSLQSELLATGRETRQAIENIIRGKAEPVASIQAEPQTMEQETLQALEDTADNLPGQEA